MFVLKLIYNSAAKICNWRQTILINLWQFKQIIWLKMFEIEILYECRYSLTLYNLSFSCLLTTEPILFFFTVKLFTGPGKVFNYLGEGYITLPQGKMTPLNICLFTFSFKNFEMLGESTPTPLPAQVPIEASRDVTSK